MSPRPYWKGYLKLSLVSCPIAVHAACSSAERVSFRQINRTTGNRLDVSEEAHERAEKMMATARQTPGPTATSYKSRDSGAKPTRKHPSATCRPSFPRNSPAARRWFGAPISAPAASITAPW